MKCPYCGREMAKGTFRSRGGNYFLPDGGKEPKLYTKKSMEKVNAAYLGPSPNHILAPDWPTAFACRECRKIILPY